MRTLASSSTLTLVESPLEGETFVAIYICGTPYLLVPHTRFNIFSFLLQDCDRPGGGRGA